MIFKKLYERYGLSKSHIAIILSKTEKSLEDELNKKTKTSEFLMNILNNPKELKELLKQSKNKLPASVYAKAYEKIEQHIVNLVRNVFDGEIFIKLVKSNELGFRNGVPGRAGSFLLIPKKCSTYFPKLKANVLNANVTVNLQIEPEKELRENEYVYYNSKIINNDLKGKDEIRLYNSNFIGEDVLLKPQDIVIILKHNNIYKMYRYNNEDIYYDKLISLIKKYKSNKADAAILPIAELILNNIKIPEIYDKDYYSEYDIESALNIPIINDEDIDKSTLKTKFKEESIENLISNEIYTEDIEFITNKAKRIRRNSKFRSIVISAYDYKCSILDTSIMYDRYCNIEACHIVGKEFGGSDNPTNGIALDMNLHWAFDKGMFTINDDYTIEVHEDVRDNQILSQIHRRKINLPKEERLYPSKEAIKYHREYIYGKFKE